MCLFSPFFFLLLHMGPELHSPGSFAMLFLGYCAPLFTVLHMPPNPRPLQNPKTLRTMSSFLPKTFPHPFLGIVVVEGKGLAGQSKRTCLADSSTSSHFLHWWVGAHKTTMVSCYETYYLAQVLYIFFKVKSKILLQNTTVASHQ